jgi:hypothetical protein
MNRFSQDNWHNSTITKADHDNFLGNCHRLVDFFGKEPDSFVLGVDKLMDPKRGLNYVAWNHELDGDKVEIMYSLVHADDDSYTSISISKGEMSEAGIDQELKVTEDPVPHLKRLISEWTSDHQEATELHMPLEDSIIKRIHDLSSKSPADEKLDTWKVIQTIQDQSKRHQLEQIFKDKIKAFLNRKEIFSQSSIDLIKRIDNINHSTSRAEFISLIETINQIQNNQVKQELEDRFKGKLTAKKTRLVRKSWKPRPNSKINQEYINELIEETLANIEMALHDEEQHMVEFFDGDWAALFEGAVDYAVNSLGSNVPHPGLITTEVLPKPLEKLLYRNVMTVGEKWGGKITDENFHNMAKDLKQVINMTFEFWFNNNQEEEKREELEEDNVESHPLYDLLARVDKANPNTPSNELIDLYNEIKALPDDENKHMLMENFKHNTKKAFNKLMNRFSKERWAQSRTVGDPPWVGNPEYGQPKFNPEDGQHELNEACRKHAGNVTERLAEEILQDLGIDISDISYKEPNGIQVETKACENWGQQWWDHHGDGLLNDWVRKYTDRDTHFGEDDTEDVFKNEDIEQQMMKDFAPAYAGLLSKISNLSNEMIDQIKNYK